MASKESKMDRTPKKDSAPAQNVPFAFRTYSPDQLREEHNPEVEQFLKGLPDGPVPFHFPAGDLLQDL